MKPPPHSSAIQKTLALVGMLFGVVTIFAGTRVLSGSAPGYVVFLPLLIYNTLMGFVYLGVGAIAWRSLKRGRQGALAIFLLNTLVLGAIGVLYAAGAAVAVESLRAMVFRALVWLALFLGLWWLSRRAAGAEGMRH